MATSSNKKSDTSDSSVTGYQFGTFKGVFTPSILTILGVIMFLRLGWVLGNAGLGLTLLIVTMCTAITLVTGLSLSATATNMKVGGGGAYYLISRSLGVEVGAAIGVPLFFAQALGVAFYISGFAEAFVDVVEVGPWMEFLPFEMSEIRFVSILTLGVLTLLAVLSADLALKAQLLILLTIGASLVSFFAGETPVREYITPETVVPPVLGFWAVFAVFFPAVTGIEAGIAMSGDLKNTTKSLPRGTIAAVLVGYVVYMSIPVFLTRIIPDERILLVRSMIMADIARWGVLIVLGVCAATLSSALGALLGAPRTMQALARDKVLPSFIGRGFGKNNDPRIATGFSFLVALAAILLGDLNMIAPVLTMFFLTSYGLINLSAGLEGLIGSPSWRPKFRFPWWGSLAGAGMCFMTMVMIDIGATLAALLVAGGIYFWTKRRELRAHWGDMRHGVLMLLVRVAIRRLIRRPLDERSWRPNVLVFSGSPQSRRHLIELADALARGPSYLTLATIMPTDAWNAERVASLQQSIMDYLEKTGIEAMVKIYPSEDMLAGAEALMKGYGFGPLAPNTFVIGENQQPENLEGFTRLIRLTHRLNRNLVMVREGARQEIPEKPRIDIWWRGQQSNIGLMLTLAYLLRRGRRWRNSRIVLKRILQKDADRSKVEAWLTEFMQEMRLDMEFELLDLEGKHPIGMIQDSSREAALVLMGMKHPEAEESSEEFLGYYRGIIEATEGLPVVLVLSAENMDFGEIIGLG